MRLDRSHLRYAPPRPGQRAALLRALVLAGLALASAADAAAIRNWCRTDPVVSVDGELADVFIAAPVEAPLLVTGPNEVVVAVPEGVRAEVILNDLGFGRGTETTVEASRQLRVTERGVEVRVEVYVPARDDGMPVRVEFAPRVVGILWPASAEGTANEWVALETRL
jgi:hypothetical protein